MVARPDGKRVRNSVFEVFRAANRDRDARKRVDVREDGGERTIAGRRTGARSSVSAAELQRCVARDLERLMNAVHFAADVDLTNFPHIRRSILNHGFADIARMSIDDGAVNGIAGEIETALRVFETRLAPDSITVRRDTAIDAAELKLRFLVRAELRADPLNVPVEFIAELERDTGLMKVAQR